MANPPALTASSLISVPRPAILVAMVTIQVFQASATISASFCVIWHSIRCGVLFLAEHFTQF